MNNAIFTTFDDTYFKYAIPFLNSIKKNYPSHPIILIFYNGNSSDIIKQIQKYERVQLISYQQDLTKLQGISMGVVNSPQIFIRYDLWSNRFNEYDNILHLDIDLIVLKPLDELINKSEFFCVSDHSNTPEYRILDPKEYDNPVLLKALKDDGIILPSGQNDMMNAGVFLVPKKYRTPAQQQRLWDITQRYNHYMMFADQSAISLWCHANGIKITKEYKYNFQASFFYSDSFFYVDKDEILNAMEDLHVYHFSWWKQDHDYYQRFIKFSKSFLEIENNYQFISVENV